MIVDHYDDNGLLLRKTFNGNNAPAIIKTAADLSDSRVRHEADYALTYDTPFGREYKLPVVDAGNTLASALYFAEYGDKLPPQHRKTAAANLKNALESFGFQAPDELTKTAAIELGYTGEAETASLEQLFGVTDDDAMEVVQGAFDGFSPRGKRRMMMKMKEASVQTGTNMDDYARSELGTDLEMALDLRKLCVLEKEATVQLASLLEKSASMDPDKLASEIEMFDLEHSLTHLYGRIIPDPYASVFGTTLAIEKNASAMAVEVDGRTYSPDTIQAFAHNSADRVKDAFGDDFAEEFTRNPVAVMHSLPVTHQQAIARMIG